MKRGKWGMGKNVCQSQNEYCGKEKDLSIVLYMLFKISSFYFFEKRANYKPPPLPPRYPLFTHTLSIVNGANSIYFLDHIVGT